MLKKTCQRYYQNANVNHFKSKHSNSNVSLEISEKWKNCRFKRKIRKHFILPNYMVIDFLLINIRILKQWTKISPKKLHK